MEVVVGLPGSHRSRIELTGDLPEKQSDEAPDDLLFNSHKSIRRLPPPSGDPSHNAITCLLLFPRRQTKIGTGRFIGASVSVHELGPTLPPARKLVAIRSAHASILWISSPWTSVRRKSRPWNLNVSFSCSIPSR